MQQCARVGREIGAAAAAATAAVTATVTASTIMKRVFIQRLVILGSTPALCLGGVRGVTNGEWPAQQVVTGSCRRASRRDVLDCVRPTCGFYLRNSTPCKPIAERS